MYSLDLLLYSKQGNLLRKKTTRLRKDKRYVYGKCMLLI